MNVSHSQRRPWWRVTLFVAVMLIIEFLDEFAYSAGEAAWPLIRDDFGLTYTQVGLLITAPTLSAILIEPIIGLFADTHWRRLLIVGGGLIFGAGFITQGLAPVYAVFMFAAVMQSPSGGAFINIAQAALMDNEPDRRENNMALWTFAGSLAVVAGPLALALVISSGGSWRVLFVVSGALMMLTALWVMRLPANHALRTTNDTPPRTIRENLSGARGLLKRGEVWRWLVLLEFSDLMLDVLFTWLALYMVDVVGLTPAEATIAVSIWTGVGLLGDFLLIPILERVQGLVYLRVSVLMELILYPAFLLVESPALKLVLLGLIGLFNAGWYAILQGKLYDELGEQSGAVLIVGNVVAIGGAWVPIVLGAVASAHGLNVAMWLLIAGPIALLIGLPRRKRRS